MLHLLAISFSAITEMYGKRRLEKINTQKGSLRAGFEIKKEENI